MTFPHGEVDVLVDKFKTISGLVGPSILRRSYLFPLRYWEEVSLSDVQRHTAHQWPAVNVVSLGEVTKREAVISTAVLKSRELN